MKITTKWLEEKSAYSGCFSWFVNQADFETDGLKLVEKLIKEEKLGWADWLIVRLMSREQYISYIVYKSGQVIDIQTHAVPTSATEAAYAAYAAHDATYAAYDAADAKMKLKILKHGIKLLEAK